jgi:hypothetical protein
MAAAELRESSDSRATLFGLLGLFAGGVLTYIALHKSGMNWPKWLRFSLVLIGSGTLGYVFHKLADIISYIIRLFFLLVIAGTIVLLIWKAV